MARQSAHRLVVLFGVFGGLTTLSTPQQAQADDMESGRLNDVLPGLTSALPPISDYQAGLRVALDAESGLKTREAAPNSGDTKTGNPWGKAASWTTDARAAALSSRSGARGTDIPESIEAPQPVEEGAYDASVPDPDAIDLTGCDLTDRLCISSGSASRGRLVNGVPFPAIPGIALRSSDSYGTPETIAGLRYAVAKVRQLFPEGTPDLVLGDISRLGGGHLNPHVSHQSGRDVDVGYYHTMGTRDFAMATSSNLDVARTWAFVEALLEDHKVEYLFMDTSVQRLLYNYVKYDLGAPEGYLEQVFAYRGSRNAIIRHAAGHRNHLHVRFWSPIAVAAASGLDLRPTGSEGWDFLALDNFKKGGYVPREAFETVAWGPAPRMETVKTWKTVTVSYRVKPGDNLGKIARAHGVDSSTLRRWNGLKSDQLRAGQRLKIEEKRMVNVEVPVQVAVASSLPASASPELYQGDDVAPDPLPIASQWNTEGPIADGEMNEEEGEEAVAEVYTSGAQSASSAPSTQAVAEPVSLASVMMPLAMDPFAPLSSSAGLKSSANKSSANKGAGRSVFANPVVNPMTTGMSPAQAAAPAPMSAAASSVVASAAPAAVPVETVPARASETVAENTSLATTGATASSAAPSKVEATGVSVPMPADLVAQGAAAQETELDMMYVSLDEVGEGFRRVDNEKAAPQVPAPGAAMALQDAPQPTVTLAATVQPSGAVTTALTSTEAAAPSKAVENARAAIAKSLTASRFRTVQRTQQATVGQGDNLWRLARSHGVSVDSILKLNPSISRNSTLRPGTKVTVKVWEERVPVESANASNEETPQGRLPFGG